MSLGQRLSLEEARTAGAKWYFTGLPCKHGHIDFRYIKNGTCYSCAKLVKRAARVANPEKARAESTERVRRWVAVNRERAKEHARNAYWRHRDLHLARQKQRLEAEPDRVRRSKSEWKKRNPHRVAEMRARRRDGERRATPGWLTKADFEAIIAVYEDAATRPFGPWHVDHIVPILGEEVCGLHVPWNLQILRARDNVSKGNRLLEAA